MGYTRGAPPDCLSQGFHCCDKPPLKGNSEGERGLFQLAAYRSTSREVRAGTQGRAEAKGV